MRAAHTASAYRQTGSARSPATDFLSKNSFLLQNGAGLCLLREFFLVPVDLLLVAVLFGKDTPAVLLHIKAKLSGPLIPRPEIGPEIPVEKFHAVLPGVFLRRGLDAS